MMDAYGLNLNHLFETILVLMRQSHSLIQY